MKTLVMGLAIVVAVSSTARAEFVPSEKEFVPSEKLHRTAGNSTIEPDAPTKLAITKANNGQVIGVFEVCVNVAGEVTSARTARSTGFPAFDDTITRVIRRDWHYSPYLKDGKAIELCTAEGVQFTPAPIVDITTAPALHLVSPGRDPKPRRFVFHKGDKRTATSEITNEIGPEKSGSTPTERSDTHVEIEYTVTDVDAAGAATIEGVYTKFEKTEHGTTTKTPSLLAHVRGHFVMSNRGVTTHSELDLPPNLPADKRASLASMRESFGKMVEEIPEQPIGVGAIWEMQKGGQVGGLVMTTSSRFELTKLAGTLATIKVTSTVEGKGAKTTMAIHGKASGEMTIDLTNVLATRASMVVDQHAAIEDDAKHIKTTVTRR